MLHDLLPQTAEIRKLAQANAVISGQLSLENLPRIEDVMYSTAENGLGEKAQEGLIKPVRANLQFSINERSKIEIDISVTASIDMQCQRCLDAVKVDLSLNNQLTVVAHDDEARSLQKDIDPIIANEGLVDMHGLVEEEILLALPAVNYHAEEECNAEYRESLSRLRRDLTEDDLPDTQHDTLSGKDSKKSLGGSFLHEDQAKENPFAVLKTLKSKS